MGQFSHNKRWPLKPLEETLSWIMKFPGGTLASCTCTYGSPMPGYFRVRGSRGTIMMEPAFNYDELHLLARFEGKEALELAPDDPAVPSRGRSHGRLRPAKQKAEDFRPGGPARYGVDSANLSCV